MALEAATVEEERRMPEHVHGFRCPSFLAYHRTLRTQDGRYDGVAVQENCLCGETRVVFSGGGRHGLICPGATIENVWERL